MTPFADLVVLGVVYTADPRARWSDGVAVSGDRIVGLGAELARELIGPRTRVIESGAGLVVPGFQDAHVHTPFAGRNRANVELNDLSGREAHLEHIARFAAAHPDLPWIVGGGWALEHFPGGTPDKAGLDAVVNDRPVFIYNRDLHGAWVNSAALRIAGIDAGTPDPPDGRIERDPQTGEPTGMLHEGAAYTFERRFVPRPSRADWEAAISIGQSHLHSVGITGWQDAWVTPDTLAAYRAMAGAGQLTARVVGALWWDRHRGLEQIDDFREQRELLLAPFYPTTVKIMIDGILENQTGALLQPYCDHHSDTRGHGDADGHGGNYGLTYVDPGLLNAAVTILDGLGFQVHMHAIGDRAVRLALDAVESARHANTAAYDHRHHIAHLQLIQPEDVHRFPELGVVANCQAYWAQSEPQMDEFTIPIIGRDRAQLQYPFGDLMRSGARLSMGSDWAVTTADPLQQLEVAVRRIDPHHRGNAPFLPEQCLPLEVALDAFTTGSAYVNHDDDAGRLTLGARADLAVLDQNLFALEVLPADATVTHTIASGTVVYEK